MKTTSALVTCAAVLLLGCGHPQHPAAKPPAQPTVSTRPAENLPKIGITSTLAELRQQKAFEIEYKELGQAEPQPQPKQEPNVVTNATEPLGPPAFRLGIEALKCRRYSGVLLYCLTTNFRPLQTVSYHHDEDLGPLKVQTWYEGSNPVGVAEIKEKLLARNFASAPQYLFVCPVLADKPGRIHIVVSSPSGRRLAGATVEITNEQPEPWLALNRQWHPDVAGQPANVILPTDTVACPDFAAAGPIPVDPYSGFRAPEGSRAEKQRSEVLSEDSPHSRYGSIEIGELPSIQPRHAGWHSLDLSMSGDVLTVKSQFEDFYTYGPPVFFLARWWVNGKPYVPAEPSDAIMISLEERVTTGNSLDMLLKLDPAAIGAKKGDKIGLQLLYCPSGWQTILRRESHFPHSDDWCVGYTNKIEFIAK